MKKVPLTITHHGHRMRIVGDGIRAPYNRSFSWRDWRNGYFITSYDFRALFRRNKDRPIEQRSGKKDKKFWRKVHRHIEKHAP